ncbi:MAG: helicase C-terminal domain-containing protein [Verrucomicrobiota bacterium JB022]|nr:helicase C-terminal domain-containing protein [Verrucomicrobiota bacterium JB022]
MIGFHETPTESAPAFNAARQLPPLVDGIFGPKGYLVRQLGLEHRAPQAQMARAVAESLGGLEPLLFEAGTGVGKSLAYLIPGLIWAQETKRPFVVSSHTIALQEQILQKDLELCRSLFRQVPALEHYADFRSALLVGKGNYLCGTRLKQAQARHQELFKGPEMMELERIAAWAATSQHGMRQEMDPAPRSDVWEWVSADGHACNNRNCTPETCFYRKARQRIDASHIRIVNHSLLFALLAAGFYPQGEKTGVLFPEDALVLDEGHTIYNVATEHFGEHLSSYGLKRALRRLWYPEKRQGLMAKWPGSRGKDEVTLALAEADMFFDQLKDTHLKDHKIIRLRDGGWAEDHLFHVLTAVLKPVDQNWDRMQDGPDRDELKGARDLLNTYRVSLLNCLQCAEEGSVYWLEQTGQREQIVTLRSAPLSVAPILRERLFHRDTGVIVTSATLAEGVDMRSFQQKIGAQGQRAEQTPSPFDYERNMQVLIAADAPAPNPRNARLDNEWLAEAISFAVQAVPGGSLVLFTSYRDLDLVAAQVEPELHAAGRPFFRQGVGGSRGALAQGLRDAGNGVLFGTESFWTGVDIAGPALQQVIITRLPFENPTHPVAQARAERVQAAGYSPFGVLMLPAALVKFRQGIGRLIRRSDDKGIITILDPRILQKPYGRQFLDVIPQNDIRRFDRHTRVEAFSIASRLTTQ